MIRVLKSKLAAAAAQWQYLPRAMRLAWDAARGWTAAWAVLLVIQGVLPLALVALTKPLVDGVARAVRGHGGDLGTVLVPAAAIAVLLTLGEALRSAANLVRTAQADRVQDHINALIQAKSAAIDLAFYDSAEYYDDLHRARNEAAYRPVAMLETVGALLQNTITLAAMLFVVAQFGAWLPIALLLGTAPALYVYLAYVVRQHLWRTRSTAAERRTWYYDWLLTSNETAAEIRLFDLGGAFQRAYAAIRARLRGERLELARSQAIAEFAAGAAALVFAGAAVLWVVAKASRGETTLGGVAMFYQAVQQGLRLMRSLLENLRELYANTLFLRHLFHFLGLESRLVHAERPATAPARVAREIRFAGVRFAYPGCERNVLRDFDIAFPAGRITAVVGPNGAGKSTLIKLLCRFYDAAAGAIEIDGADVRSFDAAELRRRIAVLFQAPVHYCATASENIGYGDPAATREQIEAAARFAGADAVAARLSGGYDAALGRWFDQGMELSTGEWQRLALARAYLRDSPIVALDEPTSAMDPWAEADWLKRFRSLAEGKTTILITHRLTTAMHADLIHVVVEGRVVESGTHDELLRRGGPYARSWSGEALCV